MKIFNLENIPKGTTAKTAKSLEAVGIATFEEWRMICDAVEAMSIANPKLKKLRKLNNDLGHLAVH